MYRKDKKLIQAGIGSVLLAMLTSGCFGLDNTSNENNNGAPLTVTAAAEAAFPNLVPGGIIAVQTDYEVAALSALDTAGNVTAENFLNSGSSVPQLSTALSSNIVPSRSPSPGSDVVILDRNNGVITWIDSGDFSVKSQMAVGDAFTHFPEDYLAFSPTRAYVTRFGAAFDDDGIVDGDDILIINPSTRAELGVISLTDLAEANPTTNATMLARPYRLLAVDGLVYVVLQNLTTSFVAATAAVAAIDPETDDVVAHLRLEGVENCGEAVYAKPVSSIYLVCGGNFAKGPDLQLARSGLVVIDVSDPLVPSIDQIIGADALGTQPLSLNSIGLIDGSHVAVVSNGAVDFATGDVLENENVYSLDVSNGTSEELYSVAGSFQLAVFADPVNGRLYIGDADFAAPALQIFDIDRETGVVTYLADQTFKDGLPVRAMTIY